MATDTLTKNEFDAGIQGISDKLDTLDRWMQKLEDHVSKIECNSNQTTERVIRLETQYEGLERAMLKYETYTEQTFKDAFEKMRSVKAESEAHLRDTKKEIDNAVRSISEGVSARITDMIDKTNQNIELQNTKQNLKIIGKTVTVTSSVFGILFILYKMVVGK